jgi:hypothetical protein
MIKWSEKSKLLIVSYIIDQQFKTPRYDNNLVIYFSMHCFWLFYPAMCQPHITHVHRSDSQSVIALINLVKSSSRTMFFQQNYKYITKQYYEIQVQ